jgi:hypothetical protein
MGYGVVNTDRALMLFIANSLHGLISTSVLHE